MGKTHLSAGLGIKAIEAGYRVSFTTAAAMIAALTKAAIEGQGETIQLLVPDSHS